MLPAYRDKVNKIYIGIIAVSILSHMLFWILDIAPSSFQVGVVIVFVPILATLYKKKYNNLVQAGNLLAIVLLIIAYVIMLPQYSAL